MQKSVNKRNYKLTKYVLAIGLILIFASIANTTYSSLQIEQIQDDANGLLDFHGQVDVLKNGQLMVSDHNIITNIFRNTVRDHIWNNSASIATWRYLAIGNGTGGTASSTTLVDEQDREISTYSEPAGYQARHVYTFSFAGDLTISETGIFNDATTGVMCNYINFTGIPVTSADTLEVRITYTLNNS